MGEMITYVILVYKDREINRKVLILVLTIIKPEINCPAAIIK